MTEPTDDRGYLPLRDKTVEIPYPRYFIIAKGPGDVVDISDGDYEMTVAGQYQADKIIERHDQLVDKLIAIAREFDRVAPKEFNEFWDSTYPRHYSWDTRGPSA